MMSRTTKVRYAVLACILASGCLAAGLFLAAPASHPHSRSSATSSSAQGAAFAAPIPLLAYYYIWFDLSSWNRAKIDYPLIGRYSSDDPNVLREQIRQARQAGIDGFIVSWKDTPTNDRRLRLLMNVAGQEKFKLAMIYQGLNFSRHALPVAQVAADFKKFSLEYAPSPVFLRLGGKPLTIWSGTWAYSHADVAKVTGGVRDRILVLSTEKNVRGYQRLADVTDGDAYYWSSVNPATNTGYDAKLSAMSTAIHHDGKYWIAPMAPGFDARLVGGKKTVSRDSGQTLRSEYTAAERSSPDLMGLISWNEFSENSYVEPSQKYGSSYLDVLRELRRTPVPAPLSAADSSGSPGGPGVKPPAGGYWPNVLRIGGFALALVLVVSIIGHRRRSRTRRDRARNGPAGRFPAGRAGHPPETR